jgi:hypothetical protein
MTAPRIWTRKTERDAVTRILEDESFADAESMADAVLKAAFAALLERDWYVTILGDPHRASCWGYGLSATVKEAERVALLGPARVVNITSAAAKLREVDGPAAHRAPGGNEEE